MLFTIQSTGQSRTKVSYLHDGALVVEYPFKMAITLETSPHPLLSTQHQLHVKRKIILPDNLVHRLEWRYYLRRERKNQNGKVIDKIGRRMRVGKAPSSRHRGRARSATAAAAAIVHAESITARRPPPSARPSGYEGKMLMVGQAKSLTPHAQSTGASFTKHPYRTNLLNLQNFHNSIKLFHTVVHNALCVLQLFLVT